MCSLIIGIQIQVLVAERLPIKRVIADMDIHMYHNMLKPQQYIARQVQCVYIIGYVRIAVHGWNVLDATIKMALLIVKILVLAQFVEVSGR